MTVPVHSYIKKLGFLGISECCYVTLLWWTMYLSCCFPGLEQWLPSVIVTSLTDKEGAFWSQQIKVIPTEKIFVIYGFSAYSRDTAPVRKDTGQDSKYRCVFLELPSTVCILEKTTTKAGNLLLLRRYFQSWLNNTGRLLVVRRSVPVKRNHDHNTLYKEDISLRSAYSSRGLVD